MYKLKRFLSLKNTKKLIKKTELKYTVNNISQITQNIEELSFLIMILFYALSYQL